MVWLPLVLAGLVALEVPGVLVEVVGLQSHHLLGVVGVLVDLEVVEVLQNYRHQNWVEGVVLQNLGAGVVVLRSLGVEVVVLQNYLRLVLNLVEEFRQWPISSWV